MKRGALTALLLAALLLAVGTFFVAQRIESLVVAAVEQVGADASGQPVALAEAEVDFARGETTDLRLRLIVPGGFDPAAAFKFDEVDIAFDVAAAFANPAVIHEMTVWSPYVTYRLETAEDGGSAPSERPQAGLIKDFVISTLRFREGVLLVSAPGLLDRDLTLNLPDMEMHDVGPNSGKATPGGLIRQTVDLALEGLAGDGEGLADKVARSLEEMGENLRAQAEAWRERFGEAAEEAGQAIKELLNGEE